MVRIILRKCIVIFLFIFFIFQLENAKADPFGIYPTPKSLALAGNLVAHGIGSNALFENPAGLVYPFLTKKSVKDLTLFSLNLSTESLSDTATATMFKFSYSSPTRYGTGFSLGNTELGFFTLGFGKSIVNTDFLRLSVGGTVGVGGIDTNEEDDTYNSESSNSTTIPYTVGLKAHFFGNRIYTIDAGVIYKRKSIKDYWEPIAIKKLTLNSWGEYEETYVKLVDLAESDYLDEYEWGISTTSLLPKMVVIAELTSGKILLSDTLKEPWVSDLNFFGGGFELQTKWISFRGGMRNYFDEKGNQVSTEAGVGIAVKFLNAEWELSYLIRRFSFPEDFYFIDETDLLNLAKKIEKESFVGITILGGSF
ncbi:MAG: hypothetical protein ABGX27_06590 [Desulfurobacteriaceae bacterium]